MKFIQMLLYIVAFFCTGSYGIAQAGSLNQQEPQRITVFESFEDRQGTYDLSAVSAPDFSSNFQKKEDENIFFGITKSAYWIRFFLPESQRGGESLILQMANPNFSKIDLYIPLKTGTESGQWTERHLGRARDHAENEIWHPDWAVFIPAQYAEGQYIYMRLETASVLRLPVQVWPATSFFNYAAEKNMIYGLFFGILLAMLIYNGFIAMMLRDRAYIFYVLYILFMFFYQVDTHGYFRLYVHIPYAVYTAGFWCFLGLTFIFATLFTGSFLQVKRQEKHWFYPLGVMILLALFQGAAGIVGKPLLANQLGHLLGVLEPVLFMSLAVYRLFQGFHEAMYYLIAWGTLAVGILIWILLPDRIMAAHILMVSTAAESVLLALALSERFKILRLREISLSQNMYYYRGLSLKDELTGLYNRRYLKRLLDENLSRDVPSPLAVLMMDIDYFKKYNDRYGHLQGDEVLRRFGEILSGLLQSKEQIGFRFGGEEFVVLLLRRDARQGVQFAEKFRQQLAAAVFYPDGEPVKVTASIGVSQWVPGDTEESLLERADKALYEAKKQGRDRIIKADLPEQKEQSK